MNDVGCHDQIHRDPCGLLRVLLQQVSLQGLLLAHPISNDLPDELGATGRLAEPSPGTCPLHADTVLVSHITLSQRRIIIDTKKGTEKILTLGDKGAEWQHEQWQNALDCNATRRNFVINERVSSAGVRLMSINQTS